MSSRRYRLHFLGLPHVNTSRQHNACAYTSKIVKGIKMLGSRGHECFNYGNEGSASDFGEVIPILSEVERASFFGPWDRQALYDLRWDPAEPYWRLFNSRAVEELKKRVRKGDFILTLAGNCQVGPVGDAFPGSYSGIQQTAALVEWGVGYYGTQSRYRVVESNTHAEWLCGAAGVKSVDNDMAVIPNFFDLDDFDLVNHTESDEVKAIVDGGPYYLYVGRVIHDKGVQTAAEVCRDIGARLVIAGQGWIPELDAFSNIVKFGHADIAARCYLMAFAVANFLPTRYREPFGGTAVESQLCGTPSITTAQGAFVETVDSRWRCASHREFCEAAEAAKRLAESQRRGIRVVARSKYSLEAVAPLYEAYFDRLHARWFSGWYEMRDLSTLEIPE